MKKEILDYVMCFFIFMSSFSYNKIKVLKVVVFCSLVLLRNLTPYSCIYLQLVTGQRPNLQLKFDKYLYLLVKQSLHNRKTVF